MKYWFVLFLAYGYQPGFAMFTDRASDLLIRDSDTLLLVSKPLNRHLYEDSLWHKAGENSELRKVMQCWTGYSAVWLLQDKELYLTNILSCTEKGTKIKADMEAIFGPRFKNGRVKANWVNEELILPVGNMLRFIENKYTSIYEGEIILTMQDGVLVKEELFDNSKTHQSIFTEKPKTLTEYIYEHIDWSKIHDLGDRKIKVFLNIIPGTTSQDFSVIFMKKSDDPLFDQEAERVVKSLPEWDVYFKRGKVYPMRWNVVVTFDEANRRQYGK